MFDTINGVIFGLTGIAVGAFWLIKGFRGKISKDDKKIYKHPRFWYIATGVVIIIIFGYGLVKKVYF